MEAAVPRRQRARRAFIEAIDNWDEPAADAAMVGLVRTAGAHEIFEILCRYGVRDFREIGRKEIYVANSFRAVSRERWSILHAGKFAVAVHRWQMQQHREPRSALNKRADR